MAANNLGRYVWLVDVLLRYRKLTFQQISNLWKECELGYGDDLPLKTFNNHRKAVKDIFDIYIECNRKDGYRYYIDEPQRLRGNSLRSWMISSYATLNQMQADKKLEDRIIFEDIPSGQTWLTSITDAMRRNRVLMVTYQGFGKPEANTFEAAPCCLKVVNRRWYMVARSPYYSERNRQQGTQPEDVYLVYALDRILELEETEKTFEVNKEFNAKQYFEGCCGIITSKEPIERVVIRAYEGFADYLRTLPLHESQRELTSDDESTLFEYRLKPTFDLYQLLLAQGDQLEVLEPESVRNEMRNFAINLMSYYNKEKEKPACKE